jgi:uncharacterized protein (DUF58 family)
MQQGRPRRHKPTSKKPKEGIVVAWLLFGWAGGHRMALGGYSVGLAYTALTLFTCGVGGIVGFIDGFVLLLGTPRDEHGLPVVWSWKRGTLTVDPLEEGTFEPTEAIARIALHGGILFFLPYLVLSAGLTLFETSQVKQTIGTFAFLSGLVLLPLFLIQVIGTWRKARAQLALLRKAGVVTGRLRLDAIARAATIVTPRGGLVLVTGLVFLLLSLAYKWADLGVIAVLALVAFYLVTAISTLLTSFVVGRFSNNLLERGASVHRRFAPGVARAGDSIEDVVDLKGVPVPPGFFLTLSGVLPPRLATEVRHVIPPKRRDERVSLSVLLHRAPRGSYEAPALRVAFTDLLGLTSAPVASLATAKLRILPAVRPAEVVAPPPSNTEEPDILSRPHRFPTEDLFRFREYVPGDDTRRIHWAMSLRAGRMIVKTPDSRESSARRCVVALDTWVPSDWLDHTAIIDDAMDALVEAWLAIGQRLVEQGEKVTLLLVARAEDGTLRQELVPCTSSNHAHWLDAGARAEWQSTHRIEDVLDFGAQGHRPRDGEVAFDNAIVVTMRLAPPQLARVARETTWVHYDPEDALGPPPRTAFQTWVDYDETGRDFGAGEIWRRMLFLPFPVGAEENGMFARMKQLDRRLEDRAHRVALRRLAVRTGQQALGALLMLPDAVYRLELAAGHHRLVGLKGSARAHQTVDRHQGQRGVDRFSKVSA